MVAMTRAVPLRSFEAARPARQRAIPALPTLWPRMLSPLGRGAPAGYPFDAPRAHGYYFARNAVWHGARLLGLDGAEVLVPAYHHGVEVAALLSAGCRPRFVRVDGRMRLDLHDLESRIGPRTRAVYVIHYAGFPQPMDEILDIARRRGLRVIEDCALALLSADGDRPLGSRGDLGVFCLYKTLPVPNGGILAVNAPVEGEVAGTVSPPLASTLSHAAGSLLANAALRLGDAGRALRGALRQVGRAARATAGRHVSTGTSFFEARDVHLGVSGLTRLILRNVDCEQVVAARRRNWFLLHARLRDRVPAIFSALPPGVCPLFYALPCPDKAAVRERLAARGIETVDFWRDGHASCPADDFPEVAALRRRVLELPIHQDLEPEDVAHLADAVKEALA